MKTYTFVALYPKRPRQSQASGFKGAVTAPDEPTAIEMIRNHPGSAGLEHIALAEMIGSTLEVIIRL